MLPSLREERAATYSPFLPIHPVTGVVMQVPVIAHDAKAGTIRWRDPDTNEAFETPVTGGHCKLQWKPDWAMRWYALGVDYEMAGKDLIDSVKLSSRIARALGAEPPAGFNYELFLDENGQKISKSKGNGLTIEEWLTYASPESLSLFMFQKPMAAKRLYFDVIPRTVDDYLGFLEAYPRPGMEGAARQPGLAHPFRRAAGGRDARPRRRRRPRSRSPCCSIWRPSPTATIRRCCGAFCAATRPPPRPRTIRASTVWCATRSPTSAISSRRRSATGWPTRSSARRCWRSRPSSRRCRRARAPRTIQHALYDIARPIPRYQDLEAKSATAERPGVSNDFFNMVYAVLLGEERGPRLGSFIALYGLSETRALIERALAGELVAAAA